jgi:peptide/nickel transport system ATP-binding protein
LSDRILEVDGLQTHFFTRSGVAKAVNGVSFTLDRGEVLGLVGESGSGKSVTGFSIMGLVDPPGRVVGGDIRLRGESILGLPEPDMRRIRGRSIAMIFQDPMMTLNPVVSIGDQMAEAVLAHRRVRRQDAFDQARDALGRVGIPSPEERLHAYPHQFSGGMRQRVAIAIALLHDPDVVIADEPTTALDVTIQSQILSVVQRLTREAGTALLWISHDLGVVSSLSDRIAVMYAGRIVEAGSSDAVLRSPRHPYTRALLDSIPSREGRGRPLAQIRGMAPSLLDLPEGCSFRARCGHASAACGRPVEERVEDDGRRLSCVHPLDRPVSVAVEAVR